MTKITGYTTTLNDFTSTTLTNLDLAKQDLINHFHIRKGEKWTNPDFGSDLPFYVFQPLDESTIDLINTEVLTIVSNDPRFELNSSKVNVQSDAQAITIIVQLIYLPTTTATELQVKFDRDFEQDIEF
jgi:phage baseplate assembly protein W